jgi:hypothetical protein
LLSAGDTSYPLLNATPSARELDEAFTPNHFELAFAEKHAHRPQSRVGLLLLLKTFQRIGYSRVVKIFKCVEGSLSSMMDVEDQHDHMRPAFGLRDRLGKPGTPAAE